MVKIVNKSAYSRDNFSWITVQPLADIILGSQPKMSSLPRAIECCKKADKTVQISQPKQWNVFHFKEKNLQHVTFFYNRVEM